MVKIALFYIVKQMNSVQMNRNFGTNQKSDVVVVTIKDVKEELDRRK